MQERKYYLLAMLIRELYSLSMNSMEQSVGGLDVTPQQMIVIKMIAHQGYTSNGKLVTEMNLSKGTVSGIVKRLMDKGLIEKEADQKDRRNIRLIFTEKGREFADSVKWDMHTAFEKMFAEASNEELENYLEVLREMADKMRVSVTNSRAAV